MRATNRMIPILLAVVAVVLLAVPVAPAYSYSSSATATGDVNATYNSVWIYDSDEKVLDSTLITSGLSALKSGSGYYVSGGYVSEGYSLLIEGNGNYVLHVKLSGVSDYLEDVYFIFDDTYTVQVELDGGGGSATLADTVFAAGTTIDVKIALNSYNNDTINDLTLGEVTFTMVSIGTSTVVPEDLKVSGTSFITTENDIEISVPVIDIIEDSDDAKEALEDLNGKTIQDNNSSVKYEIIADSEVGDHPTVLIKSTNSRWSDNVTSGGSNYSISIEMPANTKYTVMWVISSGWTTQYTYAYVNSSGNIAYSNTLPDIENWLSGGESGKTLTITGYVNSGWNVTHELRILIESDIYTD